MKKIYLLLFIFFAQLSVQAKEIQQNNSSQPNEPLPTNKIVLNTLFDETKQKNTEFENKTKSLNKYLESLLDYKSKVNNFEQVKIELLLNDLNSAINSNKNDDRIFQEAALLNFVRPLYYYSFILEDDESYVSRDFIRRMDEILRTIRNNPVLAIISNGKFVDNQKPVIDIPKLQQLKKSLNSTVLLEIKTKLQAAVDAEIGLVQKNIETTKADLEKTKLTRSQIIAKLGEQETQINDLAIKLGLPLFCVTILLLFLVPSFIGKSKAQAEDSQEDSQNVLLEISTVLLLTMSILILGLSGKIQSDVLGTLIGGISGYVLNRIRSRSDAKKE